MLTLKWNKNERYHRHLILLKSKGGRYATGRSRGARGVLTSNQTVERLIQFHITRKMVPITGRASSLLEIFCMYDKRFEISKTK